MNAPCMGCQLRQVGCHSTYDTTTWLDLADRIDGELAGREARE